MSLVCGILVGGLSRRMGRPKALIAIDGTTLLQRTVSIAQSVVQNVVLLGTPLFELPDSLRGISVIADDPPECGPIGGLAALFGSRPRVDCLLLACDMPRLDAELLRRLISAANDDVDAVVPREAVGEHAIHPCCALYRSPAAHAVLDAVASRQYAMHGLLDHLRVRWLSLDESEAVWVGNVNTAADLEQLCGTTHVGSMTRSTRDRGKEDLCHTQSKVELCSTPATEADE